MGEVKSMVTIWDELRAANRPADWGWLRWHPAELDECVRARGQHLPAPLTEAELAEVREFNRRCGGDEATLAAIEQLGRAECRVVVTGQQAGVLGGPLYALYKAAGAALLARRLQERHPALSFVPVFWVAGEDHDFEEVRRACWPKAGGELAALEVQHPQWRAGRMVGRLDAGAAVDAIAGAVEAGTHESDFRSEVLALIREAYGEGRTWEEAFGRILLRLMRNTGLVLVSPLLPWLRRRGAEVLAREAERAGESTRRVIERGEALERAGREAALHRREGAINFFWIDDEECRHALRVQEGAVVATRAGEEADAANGHVLAGNSAELAEMVRRDPERFSFNVVTRPLVQDSALPTVAQLVGPGEAAYLAQVEAVYESFGVFAPVRYPRPELTLLTAAAERTLRKHDLTAEEALAVDAEELGRRLLDRTQGEHLGRKLEALYARQREELEALRKNGGTPPEVAGAIERLLKAMEKGYATAGERAEQALRRQQPAVEQTVEKLRALLMPTDQPQERVFNPLVPFATNHGLDWFQSILPLLEWPERSGPQVISMSNLSQSLKS